jgi:hypothetical protein
VGSNCTQLDPFTGLRQNRDLFYRTTRIHVHAVQRDGSSQTSKFVIKGSFAI